MVAPDTQPEAEVLARDGRAPLLSLPRPVRRLLLAVLVLAVVAGWLVDQRLRDREVGALDACATRATAAVEAAVAPVRSMTEYVRPTLSGTPPGELRRGLQAMVGGAARVPTEGLRTALAACEEVPVLAVHDDLRVRQAGCELLVRQTIDYLGRVADNGREAFRSSLRTADTAASCAG